jgi:hypothetical protein
LEGGLYDGIVTDGRGAAGEAFVGEGAVLKDWSADLGVCDVGGFVDGPQLAVAADEPFMSMLAFDSAVFVGDDHEVVFCIADHTTAIWAGCNSSKASLVDGHQGSEDDESDAGPFKPSPFHDDADEPNQAANDEPAKEKGTAALDAGEDAGGA